MGQPPLPLAGRTALVTGSTRGIGRAIAVALAGAGARIAVNSRNAAAAQEVAGAIGGGAIGVGADLSQEDGPSRLVAAVVEAFGQLDILVNNAGMAMAADSLDLSRSEWRRTLELDLDAVFFGSQEAARHMISRGSGSIVNVSSVQAFTPLAKRVAYATAKAGVVGMTKSLAAEWAPTVRVNSIAPGYVATPMVEELVRAGRVNPDAVAARTPMRRMARSEEIAAAVVFLASEAASYITGETLMVDGGWTSWAGI